MDFSDNFINRLYGRLTKESVPEEKAKEMVVNILKYKEEESKKKIMKQNVFKSSVQRKVDGDITKQLGEYKSISSIQTDLSNRMVGMKCALAKVNPERNLDMSIFDDKDWMSKIDNVREQYFLYYVYFLNKRICDLEWIIKNRFKGKFRDKFSHMYNHQYFKLIKLKERLDPNEDCLV